MEKTLITDEIELKKLLDSHGFRYGEVGCYDKYIICYRDNKCAAPISQGIYDSPINALRDLNVIVPQTKIPIDEIDCELVMAFNIDLKKTPFIPEEYTCLDPYLYFKRKEINKNEVSEASKEN